MQSVHLSRSSYTAVAMGSTQSKKLMAPGDSSTSSFLSWRAASNRNRENMFAMSGKAGLLARRSVEEKSWTRCDGLVQALDANPRSAVVQLATGAEPSGTGESVSAARLSVPRESCRTQVTCKGKFQSRATERLQSLLTKLGFFRSISLCRFVAVDASSRNCRTPTEAACTRAIRLQRR